MKNTRNLSYPENLWIAIFGDELPVPEDAAETLDVLLAIEKRPHAHQIIDLHFKEGEARRGFDRLSMKRQGRCVSRTIYG